MSKKKIEGICHICGTYGILSFEHIPPRAAFNNRPVIRVSLEQSMTLGPDERPKGKAQQKGMGGHTLCVKCNNNTGAWYGPRFVDWCYQGMEMLIRTNGKPSLIYLQYIFPLQVLKQIVAMFLSINGTGFRDKNEELVRFVLNKEARYLPSEYRFFVYYNIVGQPRSIAVAASMDIRTGKTIFMSEITYPPYGYIMTLESEPPDKRLVEITHFSRYEYNDFIVASLNLPVLPTHIGYPGDYREKDEIYKKTPSQEVVN